MQADQPLSNLLANTASRLAHSNLLINIASKLAHSNLFAKIVGGSVYFDLLVHAQVNFCHVMLLFYPVFSTFVCPDSSVLCLRNIFAMNKLYILSYTVLFLLLLLLIAIPFLCYRKYYLYVLGVLLSGVGRYYSLLPLCSFNSYFWQKIIRSID